MNLIDTDDDDVDENYNEYGDGSSTNSLHRTDGSTLLSIENTTFDIYGNDCGDGDGGTSEIPPLPPPFNHQSNPTKHHNHSPPPKHLL